MLAHRVTMAAVISMSSVLLALRHHPMIETVTRLAIASGNIRSTSVKLSKISLTGKSITFYHDTY